MPLQGTGTSRTGPFSDTIHAQVAEPPAAVDGVASRR